VRVYIEDTDAGGIVYYANYLRFMERARTEFLRSLGVEQDALMREHDVAFVVRSVGVDYNAPARMDDQLNIGVELAELKRASLVFSQPIHRLGDPSDKPICTGRVRIAAIQCSSGRPVPVPTDIVEALHRER